MSDAEWVPRPCVFRVRGGAWTLATELATGPMVASAGGLNALHARSSRYLGARTLRFRPDGRSPDVRVEDGVVRTAFVGGAVASVGRSSWDGDEVVEQRVVLPPSSSARLITLVGGSEAIVATDDGAYRWNRRLTSQPAEAIEDARPDIVTMSSVGDSSGRSLAAYGYADAFLGLFQIDGRQIKQSRLRTDAPVAHVTLARAGQRVGTAMGLANGRTMGAVLGLTGTASVRPRTLLRGRDDTDTPRVVWVDRRFEVLVPCRAEGLLWVVDLESGEPRFSVPLEPGPFDASYNAGTYAVAQVQERAASQGTFFDADGGSRGEPSGAARLRVTSFGEGGASLQVLHCDIAPADTRVRRLDRGARARVIAVQQAVMAGYRTAALPAGEPGWAADGSAARRAAEVELAGEGRTVRLAVGVDDDSGGISVEWTLSGQVFAEDASDGLLDRARVALGGEPRAEALRTFMASAEHVLGAPADWEPLGDDGVRVSFRTSALPSLAVLTQLGKLAVRG